ncbi:hypothetical protein ACSMXN_09225 [Jatrophihabitans sp. DSM 45814]
MMGIHDRLARLEPAERTILKLGSICVGLVLICASLGIALSAQSRAGTANQRAQAACQVYKTIAEAPVSPKATVLGLTIAAQMRLAYSNAGCTQGPLKPIDPRVMPYLGKR